MAGSTAAVGLITGAGRGIGRAIAEPLADDGQGIIVADIPGAKKNVDEVIAAVQQRGRRAVGVVGDVSNPEGVERMIKEGTEALGDLTVFVANAGIAQVDEILDVKPDALDRMPDVNFKGVFYSCQLAAKRFIEQGSGGRIIGAASIVSFRPFPILASYSALNRRCAD
ncbi:SDR family NAD(P)-dependent oxidoreductase [Glutamicibacter sp. FR1]|uniref:SDR family NAD(P)-dependent oxidoreductase n=1 Tax=Glutamicibacter sp. FR1 TaxID=3393744 RepID=UPI0039AEDFC1